MKHITPMELLTLFHKTDFEVLNTTVYAHKLLSVLLTFVNHDVSQGYKAWPATELLIRRTGMEKTSLTKYRKALLKAGLLLQIVPNQGPGRSCIYYINAPKIVELAKKAEAVVSDRPVAKAVLPEVKDIHKRNTSGLVQNKPKQAVEPSIVQDDNNLANSSAEAVAVPQKTLESDYTGYRKQHYGQWCYSEEEYQLAVRKREAEMRAMDDDPDCPF